MRKAFVGSRTATKVLWMKRIGKRSCKYIASRLGLAETTVRQIR